MDRKATNTPLIRPGPPNLGLGYIKYNLKVPNDSNLQCRSLTLVRSIYGKQTSIVIIISIINIFIYDMPQGYNIQALTYMVKLK